jgi:hypothetical protein
MPFDSDVALVGTGVAPLLAASRLIAQGKTVLLLNPDFDFFLEDSELALDPLLGRKISQTRLARSWPEHALGELRPDFPGAVEFWEGMGAGPKGFHDLEAPHVRQRARMWLAENAGGKFWNWEKLDEFYVETSDGGFNPQLLDGLAAARRFPGYSKGVRECHGLLVPKLCDVDVSRFRNGLLEFIGERLGPERLILSANPIDLIPEGVRFHAGGTPHTARIREGILCFWTPRLTQWLLAQMKKAETAPRAPAGIRLWEEWSLISREPLELGVVGMLDDMTVWAELEGNPETSKSGVHRLAVLKLGPLIGADSMHAPEGGLAWASADSFKSLTHLCQEFLGWDHFSVRSMRPRAIFEWEGSPKPWHLFEGSDSNPFVQVVPACDGPIVEVARTARASCERFL